MTLKTQILWNTQVPEPAPFGALSADTSADVCIIGGGYTGLSAAISMREAGKTAALLESQRIGSGGSGRNVGYVNAGTWAQPDDLNKKLGEKDGEKLTAALGAAPKLVWDTIDRFSIAAQDVRTGNLHMAHNAAAEADIDARFEQLTRRGADVEVITGTQCETITGSKRLNKILLDKRAGTINPYAYVTGLAKAAADLGADIYEQSTVTAIEKDGSHWIVKTANGSVRAEKVIIASNAYTEGEWTDVLKSVYFVWYCQIATQPLEETISNRILPQRNGAWDTRMALSSIRRDAENRLHFGTVGMFKGKEALYTKWADTMAKYYFPYLGQPQWEYRWYGRFGFTPDHIMRIFEPAPGIIAATGFNGRGITTGTLFGKTMSQYLLDGDSGHLPIPIRTIEDAALSYRGLYAAMYDAGIALYHAGQCLRIIK